MATESCTCHSGGSTPTVLITPDLTNVSVGQMLNLTVSVSTTNGKAAGFFLEASSGKLSVVDSGTKLAGSGVTQNATRTSSGSAVTFKVGWTAPAMPGGVDFHVWANSANGNGATSGDGEGTAFYSLAYGCSGNKYYLDGDGDGVGSEVSGYTMACAQPPHYSTQNGDCADNDPRVFPGNVEVCDGRDNNCDGKVDEGLDLATFCTDADGDGHGVLGKATVVGCNGNKGFGLCDNDCDDLDPQVFPGAAEVCNGKDDNCNQQVDENARQTCGVGWCRQLAPSCSEACTPRAPRAEVCNNFDDDCDGVNDNGSDLELCGGPGLVCKAGACIASGGANSGGAPGSGGTTSNGGNSSAPPSPSAGRALSETETPEPTPSCSFDPRVAQTPFAARALLALGALLYRRRRLASRRQRSPARRLHAKPSSIQREVEH